MNSIFRSWVVLVSLILVTSCGWQLRGTQDLINVSAVHITAKQPNSDVPMALKHALRAHNITIADSATEASHSIVILDQSSKKRTLTVAGNAKASEYLLTNKVVFLILDSEGKPLSSRQTVSSERTFDNDENRPLAKSTEEDLLRHEMSQTLAESIIRALGSIDR